MQQAEAVRTRFGGSGIRLSLVLAMTAIVAADLLFYGHATGISAVLFLFLLAICAAIVNPETPSRKTWLLASAILAASLLPLIGTHNALSMLSGIAGLSAFALVITGRFAGSALNRIVAMAWQLTSGPLRFAMDMATLGRLAKRRDASIRGGRVLLALIVPMGLGTLFFLLFRSANPVIDNWLAQFELRAALRQLDFVRPLFWLMLLVATWSFVRLRRAPITNWSAHIAAGARGELSQPMVEKILGPQTVLLSLILFNALFALQTGLDIVYLWGGADLPPGLTYAEYAHRGAYPLIVTALLAAAFVLLAMRSDAEGAASPLTRALIYLWTGQNLLLVLSAMLRLDLYVQTYSLTYLRVAAFVWMLLVAIGLALIIARIALGRSNGWLFSMNVLTLTAVLYIFSFVNVPNLIAAYNIKHSFEFSGEGQPLDATYLCKLGPHALPAIRNLLERNNDTRFISQTKIEDCAGEHARHRRAYMEDWRAWTYRNHRLMQLLDDWKTASRPGKSPEERDASGWRVK